MVEDRLDAAQFIARVHARAPEADPLAAVDAASTVQRELGDVGDAVLEYFVGAARRAGHSWTAIGERLGVSKQAARQRFTEPAMLVVGDDLEIMPRLQACLDQARVAARQAGSAEVDGQHLLLGLLHVGVAAAALDRLGVTRDRMWDSVQRLFAAGDATDGEPTLSVDAKQALEAARNEARGLGHNYVGTEHVLLVLGTDPGSQARRVLQDLGVGAADVKRELEKMLCPVPSRRRRKFRRGVEPRCSFCGKARPETSLVAGPGVCICADCVRLADDVLARP